MPDRPPDCPPDLAALCQSHPSWTITVAWVTAASGPDIRLIRAERGSVRLSARTPADLGRQIGLIDQGAGRPAW